MATEYKIVPSKLQNVPITGSECRVDLAEPQNVPITPPARSNGYKDAASRFNWTFLRHFRLIFLRKTLLITLAMIFVASVIYLTCTSGYLYKSKLYQQVIEFVPLPSNNEPQEIQRREVNLLDVYRLLDNDGHRDLPLETRRTLSRVDHNRLKREAEAPCNQNAIHCKQVIDSMLKIVNTVKSNLQHFHTMLNKENEPESQLKELVKCLECKNDSITFIDDSGPGSTFIFEDHDRPPYQHYDRSQLEHSMNVVTRLLNDKTDDVQDQDTKKSTTSVMEDGYAYKMDDHFDETDERNLIFDPNDPTDKSSSSIIKDVYKMEDPPTQTNDKNNKSNSLKDQTDDKSSSSIIKDKYKMEDPPTQNNSDPLKDQSNEKSGSLTINLQKIDSNQTNSKDHTVDPKDQEEMKHSTVTTIKSGHGVKTDDYSGHEATRTSPGPSTTGNTEKEAFKAPEVVNETTKRLDGTEEAANQTSRIDNMEQTASTGNVTVAADAGNVREIAKGAVHPSVHPSDQGHAEQATNGEAGNDRNHQTLQSFKKARIMSKGPFQSKDSPTIIPTAETTKSTQQLQISPTMSWMPYQVCFYGAPGNGVPGRQVAPGQIVYPATSPGAPYPVSMPQQRMGPQSSGQAPNFVQVHAQSVQFTPMQGYFGNPGQRMGPTGPGMINYPMYPGPQASPSATGAAGKAPYYCTYIPAPTFQFPAIPGMSEYQRSSDSASNKGEKSDDGKRSGSGRTNASTDPSTLCPYNTIRCNDGKRCISRSQWCNGQVDCNDASDETTCSCRDRISQDRLCDGYFDCPHGEDELGCLGCPKTSFSCNDWRSQYSPDNCVPLSQRCDGIKQCPNGKDEVDCNILTSTFVEGKNVFSIGYTEGYLHKNFMGQWYPVCTPRDSWTKDACVSEIGSELNELPQTRMHSIPKNVYQGPYIVEINGEIKLIPDCMNSAAYVRCPQFPCGTRVPTNQSSLRPQVLEKEGENILPVFNDVLQHDFVNVHNMHVRGNDDGDDIVGSQLRVVGGRASHPNAWPFLVAINKDGTFYCGGVILNELWILTAAHCLDGYTGHYFEIQAGLLRRSSFSPMAQSRRARYTIIHPQYDGENMRNDIGMIKLDDPLRFNRWVRPVCLPESDILGGMWRQEPEVNSTCIAIGWGATRENGPDPDHLREVEVPILNNCKYEFDQHDAVICAGYPQGGRDACQGDSGGPLMCKNPYVQSQWYVAGVISHGEGCARPDEPGAYTKVSYFLNWIRSISNDEGLPPLRRSPLEKCPGFSCNGGLGKCLPMEARCNRIVDCLDGEDELYCSASDKYPLYRNLNSAPNDFQFMDPTNETSSTSKNTLVTETDSEVTDKTSQFKFTDDQTTEPVIPLTTEFLNDASTESSSTTAESTIFTCSRLLQSIPISKRCDRAVDCEDSSDEFNCTCRDYLSNLKPSAICDGFLDCDDRTDEENCEICSENEFYCRSSRLCIDSWKKCDGKFDCDYMEDERDCFTLSDGQRVYLDAEQRPSLRMQGVLTQHVNGKWRPACHRPRMHRNQSTIRLIGENMCTYFGFAYLESSEPVSVRDYELQTISWDKKNAALYRSLSAASLSEQGKTCPGVYVRCRPVLSVNQSAHLIVDAGTGSREYQWPWLAAIFVDGHYRCSAILLDANWLLSASKCTENVRLDTNYTTAVVGHGPLFRYVDGPHQQVSIIDEMQHVNGSVSVLLHLKHPANFTRYVRPLFLEKKIYLPGINDSCVAVGTDKNYETRSISLRPVLKNCQNCQRCFVNTSISECPENKTSEWSGTIFCYGKKGWYPAATFEDENGPCDFRSTQTLTSIDHVNPYLMEALDSARSSVEASCDGFRCNIGQCIPKNRVCDGVPDCRDQADEDSEYCKDIREHCGNSTDNCNCLKSELRCANGKCVDKSAFCDGTPDCTDGSDEPNQCTCAEYLKLTKPERLCDGVRHCMDKTDESPEMCPCVANSFNCTTFIGNGTCIPQDFICDGDNDCVDGEDESECKKLKASPGDDTGSGEVIVRSFGVWHTDCFSKPVATNEEAHDLCKSLGYSSGVVRNDTVITEKPMVPEIDHFYMVRLNDWTWMTLRDDKSLVTLVKPDTTCYRAFVNCV
nr:serine protease nudel isoform X2 [Nomia melanderi]